jgi:hypothetical protein
MKHAITIISWLQILGMIGCMVLVGATLSAARAYRGRSGERYSPLNHFISVPKALTIAGIVFASTILWCFSLGLSVLRAL